jgi:putative nucleotidyltransferase with HDIG domain
MTPAAARPSRAPRLVAKVLGFSFGVIVLVLAAVFLVLSWQARARLTGAVTANLELSQQRFGDAEARRQRDRLAQAAMLAESPTLKAAIDTFQSEGRAGGPLDQLTGTVRGELAKVQQVTGVPALSVTDARGRVISTVGPLAADWPAGLLVPPRTWSSAEPVEAVIRAGQRVYLTTVAPLVLGDDVVGEFLLAAPLDDSYARDLAADANTEVAVLLDGVVVAGSGATGLGAALSAAGLPAAGTVDVHGNEYVVRRLSLVDHMAIYAIGSLGAATRAATADAATLLGVVGLGALLLAGLGSAWLARTLVRPIDELTSRLARMARERRFDEPLAVMGASRELDDLTDTFDSLRRAITSAEAEAEASYLGVIGALAAALDARDRYTAGHSERVAALSVVIGRELALADHELDMLRLGALLHDIGKIGVPDAVLRKPGTLTDEEFALIERHPAIGARILEPLRLPPEVLAIVELHHEQPDGHGYPHGLRGAQIPRLAAIVHGADAFDAITSARAYRPGRPISDALAELAKHAGTGFDQDVVRVLASLPLATLDASLHLAAPLDDDAAAAAHVVLPFRSLAANSARRSVGR